MPTAREDMGTSVLDGKLYAVGGYGVVGGYGHGGGLNTLECYDPKTEQGSTLPPMPTARHSMAAAVL